MRTAGSGSSGTAMSSCPSMGVVVLGERGVTSKDPRWSRFKSRIDPDRCPSNVAAMMCITGSHATCIWALKEFGSNCPEPHHDLFTSVPYIRQIKQSPVLPSSLATHIAPYRQVKSFLHASFLAQLFLKANSFLAYTIRADHSGHREPESMGSGQLCDSRRNASCSA